MKILIADDEPLARERLARLTEKLPNCQLLAQQASNGQQTLELCEALKPDILLLDIRMPILDGLQVAAKLSKQADAPAIIFCTAHDEFALEAFQVNAIGYLVKPIRLEPLAQALRQAARLSQGQIAAISDDIEGDNIRSHISAKTHKGIELIALPDIYYFFADQKYVTVHHRTGETLIDESLKSLEHEFGHCFARIHRSTLVNINYIERLLRTDDGHYELHLKNIEQPLSVSRRHVSAVRALMEKL